MPQQPNKLIDSQSPYLLQHAHNPVDWYPWGDEAFAKSRAEDKPMFLSIGYAACHWCHVMERESFENAEIAAFLNEHFVAVKVDREEHPEVDGIYMNAVQMMTGSGGWPLSLFLTPERNPFYGGTYFPPEDRYGRRGFKWVLQQVVTAYLNRRDDIEHAAAQLVDGLRSINAPQDNPRDFTRDIVDNAFRAIGEILDAAHGGFGPAPKFPPTGQIDLLLRVHKRTGSPEPLKMVEKTLHKMASGGIFDRLAGGFHRYSTDAEWLVPHFEKMLYDNALLTLSYLDAYLVTRDNFYADVARRTLDWVLAEMIDKNGGFYSALDADSEGVEGKYYVWSQEEVRQVLGDRDGILFSEVYGVTTRGNFEGENILNVAQDPAQVAEGHGMAPDIFAARLSEMRTTLLKARGKRVRPSCDDKVLTDWNGLMIAALARGYRALGDRRYLDAARRAAEFFQSKMWRDPPDGGLLHRYRAGSADISGTLDDYAFQLWGLVELYQAGFDREHLERAKLLAGRMNELFWDDSSGGWYQTPLDRDDLIDRVKSGRDGSLPSGNAVAGRALFNLWLLTGEDDCRRRADETARAFAALMERYPAGHLRLAALVETLANPPEQVAIVGDLKDCGDLLAAVNATYLPDAVVACAKETHTSGLTIFDGKTLVNGRPAAYYCRDFTCKAPVTRGEELAGELRRGQ